jgi:iron(III) transport system ATP-binding protein
LPDVRVERLTKSYGGQRVLDGISFVANDKEFVTLLGPSGCGKTTTLMAIAGLADPDGGRISCGEDVLVDVERKTAVPAENRGLGVVFQSYAIWPHMTVLENLLFPLRVRKMPRKAARDRAREILALVEMDAHAERYPHQLSGGQQQRIALARALVYSPGVLLLDEPFSNLDAKLRERARSWLKHLQRSIGVTTIFVTHDQDEALSLSDRVLVMGAGRILRDGPPEQVYSEPRSRFVAEFIGHCNFIDGVVEDHGSGPRLSNDVIRSGIELSAVTCQSPGTSLTVAIRPEDVEVTAASTGQATGWTAGFVVDETFLGDRYQYIVEVGAGRLTAQTRERVNSGSVRIRVREGATSIVS